MTAGAADSEGHLEVAGVTPLDREELTQLIFKLMATSIFRDTVYGVSAVSVQQPSRLPFVCIREAL